MVQPESVSVGTLKAIAKAFNAHDLDAIMEFFADDCSLDTLQGPPRRSLQRGPTLGQWQCGRIGVAADRYDA
jgi:hypothetical protein